MNNRFPSPRRGLYTVRRAVVLIQLLLLLIYTVEDSGRQSAAIRLGCDTVPFVTHFAGIRYDTRGTRARNATDAQGSRPVSLGESHARTNRTDTGGNTVNVLDLLRAEGTVSVGQIVSAGAPSFVQGAYNALNNGTESIVVLTHDGAGMESTLTDALGDAAEVRVCSEAKRGNKGHKSVKDLVSAFQRRNANNPNALETTYGRINIPADGGIYDAEGNIVGFVATAA